ncbi:GLABROUS1 enhancer-binding protein-like [Rhodamnia argentea]|uniref:GLABROUS1 enhancer-binding protein-like n=1 Tax=Rhodamnia argentea TaxID=178133 RepID=A0A8B8MT20_9MYRT|nr:GLABROUS1 enhancer-binding protein-like [Rhodamnia argentea]
MESPPAFPSLEDEASQVTQAREEDREAAPGEEEEEEDYDGEEAAKSRKRTRAKNGRDPTRKAWSKADELRVLRRLLEFSAQKKENPVYDWDDIYKFIRSDLETFYTKDQVRRKVHTLKNNYRDRVKLGKKKQAMSPDELAAYGLSRKLWRDEVKGESSARDHGNDETDRGDRMDLAALKAELLMFDQMPKGMDSGFLDEIKRFYVTGVDEEFLRAGLGLIERKQRAELDEKRRKLRMAELAALVERAELIRLALEAILEAYESRKLLSVMFR